MDRIEFHRAGDEWTAVYLNGKLQRVGDSYLADEWLQAHVGVVLVEDSVCMVDDHHAYRTTEEVEAATLERDRKREVAAAYRAEAAELERRAKELTS